MYFAEVVLSYSFIQCICWAPYEIMGFGVKE